MEVLAEKLARWLLVAAVFGVVIYRNREALDRFALLRELALVVFAYFAYFGVRGVTEGSEAQAVANAEHVVNLERTLGILWEPAWQDAILPHQPLVNLMNWIYIWGHWPLIIIVATWLYTRHIDTYRLFRNAFLISGGIGLFIFAAFPVAPPRLAELDVVDTITVHSTSYRLLQPPSLVNQYAAVPSLHFGWNMLLGFAIIATAPRWWWKPVGFFIPVIMFLAIVLTANHYIVDAVAGAIVAGAGFVAARIITRPAEDEYEAVRSRDALPSG